MLTPQLVGERIQAALANAQLSAGELAALQERKLRALLRHAVDHSPFYARHLAHVDIARAPLTELPTINKRLVQEHFDDIVTDRRLTLAGAKAFCAGPPGAPFYQGAFAILMSSGTSGERGYFALDSAALADAIAMGFRQSNPTTGNPAGNPAGDPRQPPAPQRIAAVMLVEPFDAAGLLMRMIPEQIGPKRLIDIRQSTAAVVAELNDFQPTLLSSFPYMLRILAEEALAGRLRIQPVRITSSGDVLTASDRRMVKESLGCEPFDYYCSTEFPYIAYQGEDRRGMHLNADYVWVESLDDAGQPCPPGQRGARSLMTNLSNHLLPLIRYEMADQVEFLPPAEATDWPRLRTVAGRVEHVLRLPAQVGGTVPLVPEQFDEYLGGLTDVVNYQVIQEGPARLTVNYIPRRDPEQVAQRLREGIEQCWQRYGVGNVEIDWRAVAELEPVRPGATKVCHYWNRSG